MELTLAEKELAAKIGFDENVLRLVKQGQQGQFEQLDGYDQITRQVEKVDAFTAIVPSDCDSQYRLIALLRSELRSQGYLAFMHEHHFGHAPDRIAVLKTDDHYALFHLMNTQGNDHPLSHEELFAKLKEWEQRYPFEILGGSGDWIEFEFKAVPEDLDAFAQEVYEVCPDVVDQGTGFAAEEKARRYYPFKDDEESIHELAVHILAEIIQTTKRTYMWWD